MRNCSGEPARPAASTSWVAPHRGARTTSSDDCWRNGRDWNTVDLYEKTGLLSSWLKRWEMAEAAHGHESPGTLLASGSDSNPLVPIRRYEKTEVSPNEWTIKEWFIDGYAPYPEFCDFAALQYALIPILFELPPGEVVEEECQFRGDAACLFRFRWEQLDGDASKADFFRSRSQMLEARLEQIQDMITDLASNDCYEDVLQGFVGSSLRTAVGAGGAVLALAPRMGVGRKVYSEGYSPAEADVLAHDLLNGAIEPSRMISVEVASARRRYGVLALDEGGGSSPPIHQPPSRPMPGWLRRPSTRWRHSRMPGTRQTPPGPCWSCPRPSPRS